MQRRALIGPLTTRPAERDFALARLPALYIGHPKLRHTKTRERWIRRGLIPPRRPAHETHPLAAVRAMIAQGCVRAGEVGNLVLFTPPACFGVRNAAIVLIRGRWTLNVFSAAQGERGAVLQPVGVETFADGQGAVTAAIRAELRGRSVVLAAPPDATVAERFGLFEAARAG